MHNFFFFWDCDSLKKNTNQNHEIKSPINTIWKNEFEKKKLDRQTKKIRPKNKISSFQIKDFHFT
jgi:hypothetical protein